MKKKRKKELGIGYFASPNLGIELELLAKRIALVGVDVVIEEIEEPNDAIHGDDNGGSGRRGLLGDLEVPAARVLLEIEVEELVLELERLAHELHVVPPRSSHLHRCTPTKSPRNPRSPGQDDGSSRAIEGEGSRGLIRVRVRVWGHEV